MYGGNKEADTREYNSRKKTSSKKISQINFLVLIANIRVSY